MSTSTQKINHELINIQVAIELDKGKKFAEVAEKFGLKISAIKKSHLLLIGGKPIGEPIARGGPFVMNTKQEILKAVEDYQNGNFVQK